MLLDILNMKENSTTIIVINVYLDRKVLVMVLVLEHYQQEPKIDFLISLYPVLDKMILFLLF